ncbi:MAG: YkvA family protein, partial [Pseudomonadota bacterium]
MPLTVQFELDDEDLEHFRDLMSDVCSHTDCRDRERIVAAAKDMVTRLRSADAQRYLLSRLETLETLIAMLEDEQWSLPAKEADRVSYALAYFSDPMGLIPDDVPGLGFIDDAIMIELVAKELEKEISAYHDFCDFRGAEIERRRAAGKDVELVTRCDWLDAKRSELQQRMRKDSGVLKPLFSLFSR